MNIDQIYLLFGKAWDEYYPDRTPWIKLEEHTKKEWIDLLAIYECHREIYCIENAIP